MNFLEQLYIGLTTIITIFGGSAVYGKSYLPAWFSQLILFGKANETSAKKRFIQRMEVPKSWFAHMYIHAILVNSLVLYNLITIYTAPSPAKAASDSWMRRVMYLVGGHTRFATVDSTTTLLVSSLFFLQVLRRLNECCFIHYTVTNFCLLAHSVGFAEDSTPATVSPDMWNLSLNNLNVFQCLGLLLFFYGCFQQFQVHRQYAALRTGTGKKVVSLAHRIPRGGLFEKVSCPNYWFEIVIYASFCVLFGFRNYTWNWVFAFVFCNQVIAGTMNHKWYQQTFPGYPKSRKAVIPYLW